MNITNFKTQTQTLIEIELAAWSSGEKTFNVGNQFDESILESAFENTNIDNAIKAAFEMFSDSNADIMSVAHYLSTFHTPEISDAWIN